MSHRTTQAQTARHPFETPTAETVFKALLWIMLILLTIVFTRTTQRVFRALPDHHSQSTHQH
jgi:hypothetical protein